MYDGGLITFYSITNAASPGLKPTKTYTKLAEACYENRTVGIGRYSAALQFDAQISHVCRTPQLWNIDTACMAVLTPYSHQDDAVYKIYQIQQAEDEDNLPCTDFSLVRLQGLSAGDVVTAAQAPAESGGESDDNAG